MRFRAVFLSVSFATLLMAQQSPVSPPPALPNLSIPVRLSKTVSTGKSKRGDPVEFRSLEPILVGQGVVMPANAKLHGHVLGGAPRQGEKPSWLVILVESAEWKDHTLPLHAFITSQISVDARELLRPADGNSKSDSVSRSSIAHSVSDNSHFGNSAPSVRLHPLVDNSVLSQDEVKVSQPRLNDVHLMRNPQGMVFLMSQKPNLKLPGGTMFMLEDTKPSPAAAAAVAVQKTSQ